MFIINDKSFRKRELCRLRAAKFREARRMLSDVNQPYLSNDNHNKSVDVISSDVEMPCGVPDK